MNNSIFGQLARRVLLAPFMLFLSVLIGAFLWLAWFLLMRATGAYEEGFMVDNGRPSIVTIYPISERKVRPVVGADAKSFQSLSNAKDARATYAIDKNSAYIGFWGHAMPIEDSDPDSFSILTQDGAYTADKNRVYWFGVEIKHADPKKFKVIKPPYAKDSQRAYIGMRSIEVNSLESFEILHVQNTSCPIGNKSRRLVVRDLEKIVIPGWSRDGSAYYWSDIRLLGADYNEIEILNENYAKDRTTVYFRGKPIVNADAATFAIVGPGDATGRDQTREYRMGKPVAVGK